MVKIAGMRTPRGRSLTKFGVVYTDAAGNKLIKKFIKTRSAIQYSAKNKEGQLVNPSGLRKMIKKAKRNKKFY